MGPHAVDTVWPLALVLQQQHGILEHRHEWRADDARQHGEVPAHQASLRMAGDEGVGALERGGSGTGLEQSEEPLVRGVAQAAELREHRSVDADPAVRLQPQMQRGDVREPDQELALTGRWHVGQLGEQARRPVAATGAEHCPGCGVRQRCDQFAQAPRVIAGQVAVAGEDPVCVVRLIARRDDLEAELEGGTVEPAGRCDDCHAVTRAHGGGRSKKGAGHAFGPLLLGSRRAIIACSGHPDASAMAGRRRGGPGELQ